MTTNININEETAYCTFENNIFLYNIMTIKIENIIAARHDITNVRIIATFVQ